MACIVTRFQKLALFHLKSQFGLNPCLYRIQSMLQYHIKCILYYLRKDKGAHIQKYQQILTRIQI